MSGMCSLIRPVRLIYRLVIVLVAICSVAAAASAQTTVTLSTPNTHINADVTIQGGTYASADFSDDDGLASKKSTESYTRRILMKFDTQNYIPANAVIQKAELQLVLKQAQASEQRPLTAYYVTKSFSTGYTTWLTYKSGMGWTTRGGDLGERFTTTYVGNAVGTTYKFDLTAMVQKAVNSGFGSSRYTRLALVDTGGASEGTYKEFHSTRATNTALRPRLVITYGTTTTTPTTTTTTTSTGTTLRVMQWNVHKTKDSLGRCNPDRVAQVIAEQNVHVVSLNEVNFFSGDCAYTFDMGAKLQTLVQQKTGVTWYREYVNVEGGSKGYGNVILSRYRPTTSDSHLLSYQRGVAQMTIVVNGRYINLFSTHVDYANASWRTIQTKEAISWMKMFAEPRIVMGDFNTWPGTADYYLMATPYQDAWVAAKNAGTATAYNGTGATHGTSRFDYVYYSRVAALTLQSVKVPDTRVNGVFASDHDPVVATFKVN
jgi:endonuclease/exonuclease/phosphatase family metal-dependent hydrolase